MSRYFLSAHADRDLDEIIAYLEGLPIVPATRIGKSICQMLDSIADNPLLGMTHSELTRRLGVEVKTRLATPYRIFTISAGLPPRSSRSCTLHKILLPF